MKKIDAEIGGYFRQDMVTRKKQCFMGKVKADLSPRMTGHGDDLEGAMARLMPRIGGKKFIGFEGKGDPAEIGVKFLQGDDQRVGKIMLTAECLQMLKELFLTVLIRDGLGVDFRKINPGAAYFFQTPGQPAMIGVIVGQKDPADVGDGSADPLQIAFQC